MSWPISQQELAALALKHEPQASSSPPSFRKATCVECGRPMVEMWHLWLRKGGFKKEIHMCRDCAGARGAEPAVIEDLVVVATHNGKTHLERCLASLGDRYPVLVVDTHSDDPESLEFVRSLPLHAEIPFKCYATGVYLHAWEHYPAERYLFLQDSMEALALDFVEPFRERMPERGCVAWCRFTDGFDSEAQQRWGEFYYGNHYPGLGIFGCVFMTNRSSLDELAARQLLPPVARNRAQEQGNERLWAWAFDRAGMEVRDVAGMWDASRMQSGSFPVFRKTWAGRE